MEKKYTEEDFNDLTKQFFNLKDYFGDCRTLRFECPGFTIDDFSVSTDHENVYIFATNKNGDEINKYTKFPKGTEKIDVYVVDGVFTMQFYVSPKYDIQVHYKK